MYTRGTLATASRIDGVSLSDAQRQQIKDVLDAVLQSSVFHSAHRGCRFLQYVVDQALDSGGHRLKERTIGIEVFDRPPQYSTGDDAVVRVQAGDVRKRLQRFYSLPEAELLPVEIILPLGTYCPEFRFRHVPQMRDHAVSSAGDPTPQALSHVSSEPLGQQPSSVDDHILQPVSGTPAVTAAQGLKPVGAVAAGQAKPRAGRRRWMLLSAASLLAVVVLTAWAFARFLRPESPSEIFWKPLMAVHRPVLICLAKATTYHPSEDLYAEYQRAHPGEFTREWQRMEDPLPLPPETPLHWGDLKIWSDYGVASGDVYAATQLTVAFSHMQKENHLSIGQDYGYADLRQDPSVLVGAFNNRWTMEISADLPFRFVEVPHSIEIQEVNGKARRWTTETLDDKRSADYAIVARLLSADTGHFVLILGGLGSSGTEAATELVTDPQYLNPALKGLASQWPSHNIAFVVKTVVTDSVAGPPKIVASSVW